MKGALDREARVNYDTSQPPAFALESGRISYEGRCVLAGPPRPTTSRALMEGLINRKIVNTSQQPGSTY